MTCKVPRLGPWYRLIGATFPPVGPDLDPPQVLVSTLAVEPVNGAFLVIFEFTEPVYGLLLGEILVNNGIASLLTGSDGDSTWGCTITPNGSGTVSITIPAGVCQDAATNLNLVSNTLDVQAIIWLLLDRFVTDRLAGAINGTPAEPGPGGNRTVTDSGLAATITGGQYKITAAVGARDPWLRYAAGIARVSGRLLRFDISGSGITGNNWLAGWATTLTTPNTTQTLGPLLTSSNTILGEPENTQIATYVAGTTPFPVQVLLRSTGHFVFINSILHRVIQTNATTPLYPHFMTRVADAACDLRADVVGVADLEDVADPTLFPIPTLSDTFSNPVAVDYGDNGIDGAIIGGLDGSQAFYHGIDGRYTNIYSAALAAFFDGDVGTYIARAKVNVWGTPGAESIVGIRGAANNLVDIVKSGTPNDVFCRHWSGGTLDSVNYTAPHTNEATFGSTWDIGAGASGEFKAYFDGAQVGATQVGLNAFVGPLDSTACLIGAATTSADTFNGYVKDVIIAITVASLANMATIHAALAAGTLVKATLDGIFGAGNYIWYKQTERHLSNGLAHIEADGNGDNVLWTDTAAQWLNKSNRAYITTTYLLGSELVTNGNFSAWTGDDPNSWTIIETAPDPEATQRDPAQGHAGVMTVGGACNLYSSATANRPQVKQNVFTANKFYRAALNITNYVSGTLITNLNGVGLNTYNSAGVKTFSWRATGVELSLVGGTAPIDITVDDVSVKELPFASLLRVASPASADEPYFSAALTITDDTQAGVVINLDDLTTPANCIHVYYDRLDAKVYARQLIAGVWQADSLAGVAATYSAGTRLEVRRIGNEVYVFYNNAYVGSFTTTVSDANTKVALFATDNASYIQTVELYPTNVYDYSDYV